MNFLVAEKFSECVDQYLKKDAIDKNLIDAIGSHGQTLFHSTGIDHATSTLQVGDPSIIAEKTEIITIGNFRVRDLAAGDRGAPLVSLADFILYRDPTGPVALNNLGSISNLTVVTSSIDDLLAFDTGPANMAIDFFARKIPTNKDGIDEGGSLSSGGVVIPKLLQFMLEENFFKIPPPKAAGYEEFGPKKLAEISSPFLDSKPQDLLRTSVEFSACTLSKAYRDFVFPRFPDLKRVIFSGGGIHNLTLMTRIRELLPELRIEVLDSKIADAKEALAFAILANETLCGRPGTYPSMTGVKKPTILGEIAL